ncbi:hypothetical protein D3OALGA1CA_3709 [Olavius algarvensis associated proteobacterium Delta 3]|nr:hypothetical protein D3OALGA1CA_3709 [Olavius algarvensis associated proteobacterium Delta 3]CAB5148717.1 hypothetical protein D3OALGB2SA_4670 [Olavius algarvensis associated proteobacterium Delta 3]
MSEFRSDWWRVTVSEKVGIIGVGIELENGDPVSIPIQIPIPTPTPNTSITELLRPRILLEAYAMFR